MLDKLQQLNPFASKEAVADNQSSEVIADKRQIGSMPQMPATIPMNPAFAGQAAQAMAMPGSSPMTPAHMPSLGLKTIDSENPEEAVNTKNAKAILKNFDIQASTPSSQGKAFVCKDGDHLFVYADGKTSHKAMFNNTIMYKLRGGLARMMGYMDRRVALKWEKDLEKIQGHDADPNAVTNEKPSHILKELKKDRYSTVTMYTKNKETGDFALEPSSIAVIDNYKDVLNDDAKKITDKAQAQNAKQSLAAGYDTSGYYGSTQFLSNPDVLMTPEQEQKYSHKVAEVISAADPNFKQLLLHYEIHKDQPFAVTQHADGSQALSYQTINASLPYKTKSGEWKRSSVKDPRSKMTIVRPAADRMKPVDELSVFTHLLSLVERTDLQKQSEAELEVFHKADRDTNQSVKVHNNILTGNPANMAA